MPGYYKTAQVCLMGHTVTDDISNPARLEERCSKCGADTITSCPSCQAPIRGNYFIPGAFAISHYTPPAFCHKCGKPFPWTQETLDEMERLISMADELSDEQKRQVNQLFPDLLADNPHTVSSALAIGKILSAVPPMLGVAIKASLGDKIVTGAFQFLFEEN